MLKPQIPILQRQGSGQSNRWLLLLVLFLLLGGAGASCQNRKPLSAGDRSLPATSINLRERFLAAGSAADAWKLARKVGHFEAYRNFLLVYPQDVTFTTKAAQQLRPYEAQLWEEIEWALRSNALVKDYLLMTYLDLFPEGAHAAEAKRRYESLPESERLYTLEFNDRSRAQLLFNRSQNPEFDLDGLRLEGIAAYLQAYPKGVLADWMTEKFVRSYISARYLKKFPNPVGQKIDITPGELAQLQDGLEQYPGIPESRKGLADDYLRNILLRDATLSLLDKNSDSIIDELEVEENMRLQRDRIEFPLVLPELEELEREEIPGIKRPSATEKLDNVIKIRPSPPSPIVEKPATGGKTPPQEAIEAPVQDLPTLESFAERSLTAIQRGRYAYDPFPPLEVGTPYLFKISIIPGLDSILERLPAQRPGGIIPISSEMSVRVVAANPEAFTIRGISDSIQPVDLRDSTTWSWLITPKLPGRHEVIISIDIITKGTTLDKPLKRSITVANEVVEVLAVAIPEDPKESGRFPTFFYWLIPLALVLGLALWFFLSRRNRRRRRSVLLAEGNDHALIEAIEEEREILRAMAPELSPLLQRVERSVANGDTERALDELLEFFRGREEVIFNEVLALSARLRQYQRAFNLGLRPDESIPNRVNLAVINLLSYLRETLEQTTGDRTSDEGRPLMG